MEPHRTGADIAAEQKRYQAVITDLTKRMELRKWAVEKAVEIVISIDVGSIASKLPAETNNTVNFNPGQIAKELTEYFHDFVSRPAVEAIAEAEKPDAAEGTE